MIDYIGQQLGNYQLTRLVGEGAFAQVYLGEHIYLGTQAAIKVLNAQAADYPMDWFRMEARTIARLVHPNIVRVLEFGVVGNTPFLVLDYASNGSLRRHHAHGTRLPLPTVVSYVKQAAEALQYVHDEKLVHRDVKPENLLLGRRDEILLSDFGIALMMQTFHSQSMQEVAGTLSYMAPEQIQGHPSAASDQYSLAIMAYEWLAGKRPFDGSPAEVISQHLVAPPPSLIRQVPALPPAVEQVIMRALEKDSHKRFDTVQAFALALEQASQPGASQSASTAAGTNATAIAPPSFRESSLPWANEVVPVRPPVPPLSVYSVQTKPVGTIICSYRGHARTIRSLAWSADSRQIISTSNERIVHIWEALTGNQLQLYQDVSDAVPLVAWSSDGSRLAIVGSDALVRVWDFATRRLVSTYLGYMGMGNVVNALSWSPTQHFLAAAAADGTVHVWDATTGQTLCIYRGHTGSVNMLAWSPGWPASSPERSYRIVSGGDDTTVQTWDSFTGRNIALYRGYPAKVLSVAWSPNVYSLSTAPNPASNSYNSSRVACGKEDGWVQMWDTTADRDVLSYRYAAPLRVVAWSPDGRRFAYASDNNTIEVWDTRTNLKLFTFSHAAPLHAMSWSPDGKYIASGGDDAIIQVWVAP